MANTFELWAHSTGNSLFGIPRPDRAQFFHESGSRLLLLFRAQSQDEARSIMERFLYEGNPDELVPLNIPASQFFLSEYRCGCRPGDEVRLKMDYHCTVDGYYCGYLPAGCCFVVIEGDVEAPQFIWMRVSNDPSGQHPAGQFHYLPDDENVFTYFERCNTQNV